MKVCSLYPTSKEPNVHHFLDSRKVRQDFSQSPVSILGLRPDGLICSNIRNKIRDMQIYSATYTFLGYLLSGALG